MAACVSGNHEPQLGGWHSKYLGVEKFKNSQNSSKNCQKRCKKYEISGDFVVIELSRGKYLLTAFQYTSMFIGNLVSGWASKMKNIRNLLFVAALIPGVSGALAQGVTIAQPMTSLQPMQPAGSAPAPAPAAAVAPAAPPVAVIMSAPSSNIIRAGTPIFLRMSETLTTKGKLLRVGQRFNMEVAEAVSIDGVTVIPVGSPALGEVTEVRNKGMWGKSGGINARVLYLRANGRQIRLTGSMDDKGVTGTAGVVAAIAFVPIAGFFTTGTSAVIPLGAPIKSFLDEDITVGFAAAAQSAPMMVIPAATPNP